MTVGPSSSEHALSPEQIELFVERGYVLVRRCFSRAEAARLVRATLVDRSPEPSLALRQRDGSRVAAPDRFDLSEPATWGCARLDIDTGRALAIETFAPRLWGAIASLVGPGRRVTRTMMGEKWIANSDFAAGPRPSLDPPYTTKLGWHLDAPSERTTLDHRLDALVLLALWNDVEPGAGGPLVSGQSLEHVVRALEAKPDGVDTRDHAWAAPLIARCTDVEELAGQAGDVIVAHAFVLHAAHPNYLGKLRVLENPTITVDAPLDYHTDNPDPSAVERAVLRRLSRPRVDPDRALRAAAWGLADRHADYFLPDRARWTERVSAEERRAVHALDVRLAQSWVERVAGTIRAASPDPFDAAVACAATVRELCVNQRVVDARSLESAADADFGSTSWARLVRGFVSTEAQNHLLGLLLARLFDRVTLFETDSRTLVRVESPEGWFFADATGAELVFHVRSLAGAPHPRAPELERGAYEHGRETAIRWPEPAEVDVGAFARTTDAAPSAWTAYLHVRIRHLDGTAQLGPAYDELLARYRLGGTTKAVVEELAKRARRGRGEASAPAPIEEQSRALALYAKAASGEWSTVLAEADRGAPIGPAAALISGVSGDIDAVRRAANAEAGDGPLAMLSAATFEALGFHDAALARFRASLARLTRSQRADVCLEAAEIERARGDLDAAVGWARRALLTHAADDRLLLRACEKLKRSGAFDDALAALSERCERAHASEPIALALIELLLFGARVREARRLLEPLGGPESADAAVVRMWAIVACLEQRWDDARALWARILEASPSNREACAWTAEIELRAGDPAAARRWLEESRTLVRTTVHIALGAAIGNGPENDRELVALLEHLGEPIDRERGERVEARALALLESFGGNRSDEPTRVRPRGGVEPIRLPPDDSTLSSRDASAALLKEIRTSSPAELQAKFAALAAEFPASPHPHCYWGELDLWLGNYEIAMERFARALERSVTRWGYVGAAAALVLLRRYDEADEHFAECARRFEPIAGATTHVYAGEARRRRGDLAGARAHLEEAVRVKPGRAAAWMNLALVHAAGGATDEARRIFTMLEARFPRLYWDAHRESTGAPAWPVSAELMPELFEHALEMMRGNRSSHTITYFDRAGAFRVVPDAERLRATLEGHVRLAADEIRVQSARRARG